MAGSQNRKRQVDDPSQEQLPTKKFKSKRNHRSLPNFPPEFWDNLSKVWLTTRALRELDRRNNLRPLPAEPSAPASGYSKDLARFARRGGPDLCHLQGYPKPMLPITSSHSSTSRSQYIRNTQSTPATELSSKKIRRSSTYNDDFEQHLNDHNIYLPLHLFPDNRPTLKPGNLNDIRESLRQDRPSLSPSRFSDSAFEDFQRKSKTRSKGTIMRNVIPIITGNVDIPNDGHLPFTNFDSMTNDTTVKAVPDFYDGAHFGDVDPGVRDDLNTKIIPTKHAADPVVPSFFMEAKAPRGTADVAQRQACYDGAYGARAMHVLQNYGNDKPVYDNNAYTYSTTYHAGPDVLKLYVHHVTAPTTSGEKPEYHMAQVDTWAMTGNIDSFRKGATAFRNARDWAKEHRDRFIRTANAKAKQSREYGSDI